MRYIFYKMYELHNDQGGQVLLFTSLVVLVLVCFVALVVNVGELVVWRIRMQNAVDAAALAAGTWQARGLNKLQMLNNRHWDIRAVQAAYSWFLLGLDWLSFGTARTLILAADRIADIAVRGVLFAQQGIKLTYPGIAVARAIAVGRDNGADRVVPIWPMPNPCGLDVEERNRSRNLFFYEMPSIFFAGIVSWDDPGYYGGSPEPVTFVAYKDKQFASRTFLLLPGLLRGNTGEDLNIPMINTIATLWTRRQPRVSGNTQLSDKSWGSPRDSSLGFTTSLSPVVLAGGIEGKRAGIYH